MPADSKSLYEFKKKLRELQQLRGSGTELVTIYIAPTANPIDMSNRLRQEYGQAENIKSKQTRKNVLAALERLIHALKNVNKAPPNGLVLFAGNISGKVMFESLEPPEPVAITTYRCDSTFFLEPLADLLAPKQVIGLMTVDRRESTIALLKGKRVEIIRVMGSQVPGKHHAGGQSSVRFERLHDIAVHEWFKKIGDEASKAFDPAGVAKVIVGGPGPTKQEFLQGEYLSAVARKKVAGTVDTSYTDEFGIREMLQKTGEIMKDLEVVREKELVNKFLGEAATGGLATYGENEVRAALLQGKAATLMLSESLAWKRASYRCPHCGHAVEKTVKTGGAPSLKCEKCGSQMAIESEQDVVQELAGLAANTGAAVEMISTDTPEGTQFADGFGGIGALLRFK
jgi:peptide chain release factor subunit 1